jgi:hypothetical protein
MSKQEEIKESASLKVWSKLYSVIETVSDPEVYWKMDPDRQKELRERDMFEEQVWSYIYGLIEKDNRL